MADKDYGRIERNSPDDADRKIEDALWAKVDELRGAPPEEIEHRLRQLEEEWDIERTLATNAAALSLGSLLLGVLVNRKFLWLTGAVLAFLLQHGVQGWCPPLPIFRHQGVRTPHEIEQERFALKFLRGDFDAVLGDGTADLSQLRQALER